RHGNRERLEIQSNDAARAQQCCRDSQHAGAGAEVEHRIRRTKPGFEPLQTEPRCWVESGSERHAGIQVETEVVWKRRILPPGRHDHQAAADPVHEEMALPGVRPILILESSHLERLDLPQAPEIPDRLLELTLAFGTALVERKVGLDD